METLCSIETSLMIITIAVTAIGILTAIIIFMATWINFKSITRKKDIELLKKAFLHTYNNELKKLSKQEDPFNKTFSNFDDLIKYIDK